MTSRKKYILFCMAIFLLCFTWSASRIDGTQRKHSSKNNSPLKEWFEGPVRYIITKDEETIFKSLQTEQQRAAFINRFWSRRDPTPETPDNEFRYEFWQRVINANFLFAESSKPGWKTDRGKVYIIMGPANEIEQDPDLSQLGTSTGEEFRGITRWIYQGTGRTDLDPIFIVAFYKDPSGEYRLSYDPKLNSVFYDRLGSNYRAVTEARTRDFQQTSISELAVTLDQGKVQQLPPKEEIFTAIVTDKQYFGAIPLKTITGSYSREAEGKTLLSLTLAIKKKDIPSYNLKISDTSNIYIIARLISVDDPTFFYNFPEGSFTPSPSNDSAGEEDYLYYQLKTPVSPGKYTYLIGVFDRKSEYIGSYRETLDIPSIKERALMLSSITIAEKIEQKEGGAALHKNEPFWFGDLFVIPRSHSNLMKGDLLTFVFQISVIPDRKYFDEHPEQKNAFKLNGTYQFFKKNSKEEYIQIGKPIPFDSTEPFSIEPFIINRGRSFETANWPSGDYKLLISITDERTNETDSQEIYFSIS